MIRGKTLALSMVVLFMASAFSAMTTAATAGEWSEPLLIGEVDTMYPYDPVIASNSYGWQIVAWSTWDGIQEKVFANRFDPSIGWVGTEFIGTGRSVSAGIDDNGNSTVAWVDGSSVLATRYVPWYGEWDDVTTVCSSGTHPGDLVISVSKSGAAAAAWEDFDGTNWGIFASIRAVGRLWMPAELIEQSREQADCPDIGIDERRNAIAVWSMYDSQYHSVWANRYVFGEGWGTETLIESQSSHSWGPSLDVNSYGMAVAGWASQPTGYNLAFANIYTPGVGWGTEVPLDDPLAGHSQAPDVDINDAGDAVAAWSLVPMDASYYCARASLFDAESGWGAPTTVQETVGGFMTAASISSTGDAYVAWLMQGESWDSYVLAANRYTRETGWEREATVSEMTNLTGFDVTADAFRNATIVWSGFYEGWGIYVSDYFGTAQAPEGPEAVIEVTAQNSWKSWKFDGRGSTDDVRVVKYLWDFGDGQYADTKVAIHTYQKAGEYVVTLTVWDADGNSDSASTDLSVKPSA